MTKLQHALNLAKKGFYVFPLYEGSKLPAIKNFSARATREAEAIKNFWTCPVTGNPNNRNIGISTHRFHDGAIGRDTFLVVVDIDRKPNRNGYESKEFRELCGDEFPDTWTQNTPTGGAHLFYISGGIECRNGVDVFGPGLDVRARGGYVVGAGSEIYGRGAYTFDDRGLLGPQDAPRWLVSQSNKYEGRQRDEEENVVIEIDETHAEDRAKHYLLKEAPLALEGQGGDQTTFAVAARVRDFGVGEPVCLAMMQVYWNDRCEPPWSDDELKTKVENAYAYATEKIGSLAPERDFTPIRESVVGDAPAVQHPFDELNKDHAFVLAGGGHHILWETTDVEGRARLEHLAEETFHKRFASKTMLVGDKPQAVTRLWLKDKARRSYDGMCFVPGKVAPANWYNLWRGFAVEPAVKKERCESVDAFLEHAKENVCGGDEKLFRWLIGYFAHLVQRPYEKPLVALVFRGSKGVGKNALVERIGYLLGGHSLVADDRRYLTSNFNGHLENCLMLTLDEAFWSGDKQAEGRLKGLITGTHHNIERKGQEAFTVANCTRVVIIGNEDWLVPASQDERRFAVFQVGEGRKTDRKFFQDMREGMEAGGYAHLLRYLLDFDLTGIDVNKAPATDALLEQKEESLPPFESFWLGCLQEGQLLNSDFHGAWGGDVLKTMFREAFQGYCRNRNIRGRLPDEMTIGKTLARLAPSIDRTKQKREGERLLPIYRFSTLEDCRKDWERYMGHVYKWEETSEVFDPPHVAHA